MFAETSNDRMEACVDILLLLEGGGKTFSLYCTVPGGTSSQTSLWPVVLGVSFAMT